MSQRSETIFTSVRFGNVIGSRGSVVPTFAQQIERGGPVTVTHPDMHRFFMSIPEAVSLVLEAAALGRLNEVFMLEMGDEVSILELARRMIRLRGMRVGQDIDIAFTGIRPGEKLREQLAYAQEELKETSHSKIYQLRCPNSTVDSERLLMAISMLMRSPEGNEREHIARDGLFRIASGDIEGFLSQRDTPAMTQDLASTDARWRELEGEWGLSTVPTAPDAPERFAPVYPGL